MTIYKKVLLLIAIPLLAQAVFIGILLRAQAEGIRAQLWAVHTKEVIAKVEETYRRLLEGYARLRNVIASGNRSVTDRLDPALDQIPGKIAAIKVLVRDNLPQQARIDELAAGSQAFLELLAAQESMLKAGDSDRAFELLEEGGRRLGVIRTSVDAILADEAELDRERTDRLRRLRVQLLWIVVGGSAAILAATAALAYLLLDRVVNRLAVLRDNTRRLAEGKGLKAPQAGRDEVAEVDRAFHDMAASLDQQKAENEMFVYSVSHDLRSPLINLQGFSEELSLSCRDLQALLDDEKVPTTVRQQGQKLLNENFEDSIRYIQTAVGRLLRIIDALLRLSRAGRVEYQWRMVEVAPIVQKVVDALHDTVAEKQAEVRVGELPPAWGDATAVEQIFANLIVNAVQYLDPARPGEIEVGSVNPRAADNPNGNHVYYVRDNGLGIPAAYHPRVFTAFARFQTVASQGEGVGLALVSRMVERHGGRIWLQSSAGSGTTFFVALPAAPAAGALRSSGGKVCYRFTAEWSSSLMALEPLLIVLVEDDDGHATLVERNLKRVGVSNAIVRLRDGQQALDFLFESGGRSAETTNQPILLLLDIKMPRVDGLEVLRQLKANPQTALIPVIMLTTTDDPREIQRCYELGCSVYIAKPVDYQAFVDAINRLGLFLQVVRIPECSQRNP